MLVPYHDAPISCPYDTEGTFNRIASRYYFPGMRLYISEYVKDHTEFSRHKACNTKSARLFRNPLHSQKSETMPIDFFGPLPESSDKKKWTFIVEDTSSWLELFVL
ncbi:hypothetical protein AVEN_26639-1 [Araneus ventricosus]|uniref:Uncharacterized protein n=1 Tax=Araneus ventricosus TaxID=182803 RepID=A0A4Y2NF54_ARAVE|nr:hypothetical protein AVEN_26639-1 [Araneus ventricosus]